MSTGSPPISRWEKMTTLMNNSSGLLSIMQNDLLSAYMFATEIIMFPPPSGPIIYQSAPSSLPLDEFTPYGGTSFNAPLQMATHLMY